MAITNTWNVVQMNCYPQEAGETDVVFTIHWTLTGDDGEGHTGSVYGTVGVTYNPDDPFTPYNQLTLEQCVAWVKDALGAEQVDSYEANVAKQIENQINPTTVTLPIPW